MDRSLLERMIGATLLVILLVVLAPALLDGRQSPGSEPGESSPDVMRAPDQNVPLRVATIRLNESAVATAPAAAPPLPAAPPVSQAASPEPKSGSPTSSIAVPAPAPAVKSAVKEQWAVQLGSFSAQKNANEYAGKVKAAGFPASVSSFRSGGKTMYRVQVGPRDTRDAADKLVVDLKKAGYKGLVMPVT